MNATVLSAAVERIKELEDRLSLLEDINTKRMYMHEKTKPSPECKHNSRSVMSKDGGLICNDCGQPSPECEPVDCKTICDTCGEYDYDCECKPYISIPRSVAEAWCKDCMKPVTDYRLYNALRTALKQNGKDQK
jgi:hypothetical protein